jgi:hypothetical protein
MATEKTTGRQAVDYGDQVAGLHNVCDDLGAAVAEGLRFWPRRASVAERGGGAGCTR